MDAPAVTVAAPNVQVPPAQVTVNVPDKRKAIYVRRNFINCNNKQSVSTCDYAARRLCRTIGYKKHLVIYSEPEYARANGLVCYDEVLKKQ